MDYQQGNEPWRRSEVSDSFERFKKMTWDRMCDVCRKAVFLHRGMDRHTKTYFWSGVGVAVLLGLLLGMFFKKSRH